MFKKTKFPQILGILNNNFALTLVQKSSTVFYLEANFGPSDKWIKATDTDRDKIFKIIERCTLFDIYKRMKKLWKR